MRKCIIEGEVNKPITMQIFVDSIKTRRDIRERYIILDSH